MAFRDKNNKKTSNESDTYFHTLAEQLKSKTTKSCENKLEGFLFKIFDVRDAA